MSALYYRWNGKTLIVMAISSMFMTLSPAADAQNFTSGVVMDKMKGGERHTFVAGIIEGLSIARYAQDGKKPDGMNCITHWFYDDPKTIDRIYTAFDNFRDYPPGSVVDAMARKQCP